MTHRYAVGQLVAVRADPSRQGSIIEALTPLGGAHRYRVFHGPTRIVVYQEDQIQPVQAPPASEGLAALVTNGVLLDAATFKASLTAARLKHPQIDNLYAVQAARIQYVPFQFKPVLRFLRADAPRLLIADEVGVGKTIEAGLILKELEARQRVDNVLIVCPKALVPKWRAEMKRFDEDFRPLDGQTLAYCIDETDLDGVWPQQYGRAIVHLELLRGQEYMDGRQGRFPTKGLRTLPVPPHFDLVIVDEAHHVCNPETSSHSVAEYLCEAAEAVVFLSATPVHLGDQNLYTLLRLLRPDDFPSYDVFREMIEPCRYINQAMRHIRSREPGETWQRDAADAMAAAARTSWGRQTLVARPELKAVARRLVDDAPLIDAERVTCLRELEELHSLAHVVNRTRRRDIGRFTVREPHAIEAPFTAEQWRFYERLLEFRRELLLQRYDERVVALIMDTLERQASSCLPALVPALAQFLSTGRFSASDVTDDPEVEDETVAVPGGLESRAEELRRLAAELPEEDRKLESLLTLVREALRGPGPGKLLVFSFFLHTLAYLERHLRDAGVRVAVVNGKIPDEEREGLRERFRLPRTHPDAVDVLLSSEVGCEGLDYEFCDRLVNYDIPWNAMRIEQRIGRIDRFGQNSEKVLIYNFVTPGTVEHRIYYRCFARLDIFRNTLGDLEEVLGELMPELNRAAMDPTLSPAQMEQRANQLADNVYRRLEEERRLEEAEDVLLGLDEAFVDEVTDVLERGRFVAPDDLRHMVSAYLEAPPLRGRLAPDAQNPGQDRLQLNRDGRNVLGDAIQALQRRDQATQRLLRWLQGSEPSLTVTFNQAVAAEHRDLPFITPVHPLATVAVAHWTAHESTLVAQLRVRTNDGFARMAHRTPICQPIRRAASPSSRRASRAIAGRVLSSRVSVCRNRTSSPRCWTGSSRDTVARRRATFPTTSTSKTSAGSSAR